MKPENFILTSDYATLANDGRDTITVTIPGSQIVPGGTARQWTGSKIVGVPGAFEITQLSYTGLSGRLAGPISFLLRRGNVVGIGAFDYPIRLQVARTSPDEITAVAEIWNMWAESLTTNASPITFTFYVSTFIPPFS